jgi:hypothetical protein
MTKLLQRAPSYRRHKATGQAVVTFSGHDFYLGPWNSATSKVEYQRVTREWFASGGTLPLDRFDEFTVVELLAAFKRHAKGYYIDSDGKPSQEQINFRTLTRRLAKAYGRTLVKDFGPLRLKAFRESLIDEELARTNINHNINRVRHIFMAKSQTTKS